MLSSSVNNHFFFFCILYSIICCAKIIVYFISIDGDVDRFYTDVHDGHEWFCILPTLLSLVAGHAWLVSTGRLLYHLCSILPPPFFKKKIIVWFSLRNNYGLLTVLFLGLVIFFSGGSFISEWNTGRHCCRVRYLFFF